MRKTTLLQHWIDITDRGAWTQLYHHVIQPDGNIKDDIYTKFLLDHNYSAPLKESFIRSSCTEFLTKKQDFPPMLACHAIDLIKKFHCNESDDDPQLNQFNARYHLVKRLLSMVDEVTYDKNFQFHYV